MIYVTLPSKSSIDIYPATRFWVSKWTYQRHYMRKKFSFVIYGTAREKSWIQIHEGNESLLLFKYAWNGCWTERKDTSRTQDHKFTFGWFWYSLWLRFLFQQFYVIVSHGVSIKIYGSDLAMRLGFKENEILRGPTPIVSIYTALYIYTDIIQKQLVGDLGAPEKSRYGDTTCVTNELF